MGGAQKKHENLRMAGTEARPTITPLKVFIEGRAAVSGRLQVFPVKRNSARK
jgi:hypothetical protein